MGATFRPSDVTCAACRKKLPYLRRSMAFVGEDIARGLAGLAELGARALAPIEGLDAQMSAIVRGIMKTHAHDLALLAA